MENGKRFIRVRRGWTLGQSETLAPAAGKHSDLPVHSRLYRPDLPGESPAPELERWGTLFVDGLKLLLVQLSYAVPVILLLIIAFLPFL